MANPQSTTTIEEWRDVPGYEGSYEVSSSGQVRGKNRTIDSRWGHTNWPGKALSLVKNRGYCTVGLRKGNSRKIWLVHRLVLMAFDRPPVPGEQGNHKDFDRSNNHISNLEWVTGLENVTHAELAGRRTAPTGESSPHAKLTEDAVRDARQRFAAGETMSSIARSYGVTRPCIGYVVRRDTWTKVA